MSDRKPIVYVVDDDNSVCCGLTMLLRANGYAAHSFCSGHKFLAAGIPKSNACIIVDYCMPDMDGFELKTALDKSGCTAPVILITALADSDIKDRARKAGMAGFLWKPMSGEALTTMIQKSMRKSNSDGSCCRKNV